MYSVIVHSGLKTDRNRVPDPLPSGSRRTIRPEANFIGVDLRKGMQVSSRSDHVFSIPTLLVRTSWASHGMPVRRSCHAANSPTVPASLGGQILIRRAGIVVVIHVVEAQHHMPDRAACTKTSPGISPFASRGRKSLPMQGQPTVTTKDDLFRR